MTVSTIPEVTSSFFLNYLFGKQEYEKLILEFLNALLKKYNIRLKSVEQEVPYTLTQQLDEKSNVIILNCRDIFDEIFVVSLRPCCTKEYFRQEAILDASRILYCQQEYPALYSDMHRVICIQFGSDNIFQNYHDFNTFFELGNTSLHSLSDMLAIHFINVDHIDNSNPTLNEWSRFFTEKTGSEFIGYSNPYILQVIEIYRKFLQDNWLMEQYKLLLSWRETHKIVTSRAEENGLRKGIREGMRVGMQMAEAENATFKEALVTRLKERGFSAAEVDYFLTGNTSTPPIIPANIFL